MSLAGRIAKAQGKPVAQVRASDGRGKSTWVQLAQQGARIGQPLNGQGIPVKATGGGR